MSPLMRLLLFAAGKCGNGAAHAHAKEEDVVEVDVAELCKLRIGVLHIRLLGEDGHLGLVSPLDLELAAPQKSRQ